MKKDLGNKYIDEDELDALILNGNVAPVRLPALATLSEIVKFQFCSEIILFKRRNNLQQKDIAEILGIHKSEVSKIFSYNLKEFSQERVLGFIQTLLVQGFDINLDLAWDKIKQKSKLLPLKSA